MMSLFALFLVLLNKILTGGEWSKIQRKQKLEIYKTKLLKSITLNGNVYKKDN
jgi:hypothetical protein